jgi:hypothetical protein
VAADRAPARRRRRRAGGGSERHRHRRIICHDEWIHERGGVDVDARFGAGALAALVAERSDADDDLGTLQRHQAGSARVAVARIVERIVERQKLIGVVGERHRGLASQTGAAIRCDVGAAFVGAEANQAHRLSDEVGCQWRAVERHRRRVQRLVGDDDADIMAAIQLVGIESLVVSGLARAHEARRPSALRRIIDVIAGEDEIAAVRSDRRRIEAVRCGDDDMRRDDRARTGDHGIGARPIAHDEHHGAIGGVGGATDDVRTRRRGSTRRSRGRDQRERDDEAAHE